MEFHYLETELLKKRVAKALKKRYAFWDSAARVSQSSVSRTSADIHHTMHHQTDRYCCSIKSKLLTPIRTTRSRKQPLPSRFSTPRVRFIVSTSRSTERRSKLLQRPQTADTGVPLWQRS